LVQRPAGGRNVRRVPLSASARAGLGMGRNQGQTGQSLQKRAVLREKLAEKGMVLEKTHLIPRQTQLISRRT
jgi:hypothetical protein